MWFKFSWISKCILGINYHTYWWCFCNRMAALRYHIGKPFSQIVFQISFKCCKIMKVILFRKILIGLLIGYSVLTITLLLLETYSNKTIILMGLSALGCIFSSVGQIKLLYSEEYRDKIHWYHYLRVYYRLLSTKV